MQHGPISARRRRNPASSPHRTLVSPGTTSDEALDAERWTNEGGSFASEKPAVSATTFGSTQAVPGAAADVRLDAGAADDADGS